MPFLAAVWEFCTFILEVLGIAASLVLLWRERKHRRKMAFGNRTSAAKRDSDLVVRLCVLLFAVSATSMVSRLF
ncbi:hypothetical protein [Nitratireductor sp. XY-223]|uniref:hypothetical protein n=1 Tax=Nitratireductor sp. XY-223 TaxID=2561926 RepID=UPI0010A9A0C3|nr:hypothetical protein [Nitratireductor sp. XY-223]